MKSILVSGYDLADIHGVVVVIAVPLVLHFLSHVVRCDVGHTALAADEYQLGLLEGRLTLYRSRASYPCHGQTWSPSCSAHHGDRP